MSLALESASLLKWLHLNALPLWTRHGYCAETGSFYETMDLCGTPTAADCRSRVPPRQIYCFAEAGAHGWNGASWQRTVVDGLHRFEQTYRLPNGYFGALASVDGQLIDESFDLYNHAFAILAFSYAAKALPDTTKVMSAKASQLLHLLKRTHAHASGGFHEAVPTKLPLCSNPHMHLFEASLACQERDGFEKHVWASLADEIAQLCLDHFIDRESGGLREFFNVDWCPYSGDQGRIMEPGHQFEWAWLLARWAALRKDARALSAAKRLFSIGEDYGVCARRHVVIMALLDDFSVHNDLARLWPQTEWLKSAVRLALLSHGEERQRYLNSASRAVQALKLFLDVPILGLWRDKLKGDGSFIEEAAPASSLYHILGAIYEFDECLDMLSKQDEAA